MPSRSSGLSILTLSLCLASSTARGQLVMKGADSLEDVTRAVLADCPAAVGVTYVGGGSSAGEAAMLGLSPTQQIAPMSRELAGAACAPSAGEVLLGLDGISVIAANQTNGNSQTTAAGTVCTDTVSGGSRNMVVQFGGCTAGELAAGACTVDRTDPNNPLHLYSFGSWRDVLAMVYGGQNNGVALQTLPDRSRNRDRIDCAGNIRRSLVDNWSALFVDSSVGTAACRTRTCVRLKHAFRLGDLSGTTDTFVSLIGMLPIPPFTTLAASNVPKVDGNAAVNPFCNAGEKVMNKGDSDYMDMDPIRRIADSLEGDHNRQGQEQVAQGFWAPSNPPAHLGGDVRENDNPAAAASASKPLTALPDFSHPAAQNWSFDPNTPNALALQRDSFLNGTTNARQGLGVVLVIEFPTNYAPESQTYFEAVSGITPRPPVPCTVGKFAPSVICGTCVNVLCPDGATQTCNLPVDTMIAGTLGRPNFNCLSDRATPNPPPGVVQIRDPRVYNLLVLTPEGKVVKDAYMNPNLTLPATRQNRMVSAFFRLHTSEVTKFGGNPTIAGNTTPGTPSTARVCAEYSSTAQIGCLVRASPCSVGYAARTANTNSTTFAAQLDGLQASDQNIRNFATLGSPTYPMARGLWLTSAEGFGAVTDVDDAGRSVNERQVLECFGGGVFGGGGPADPRVSTSRTHQAMQLFNFVPLDQSPVSSALLDCAVP